MLLAIFVDQSTFETTDAYELLVATASFEKGTLFHSIITQKRNYLLI